jgi:hypothetical protein
MMRFQTPIPPDDGAQTLGTLPDDLGRPAPAAPRPPTSAPLVAANHREETRRRSGKSFAASREMALVSSRECSGHANILRFAACPIVAGGVAALVAVSSRRRGRVAVVK